MGSENGPGKGLVTLTAEEAEEVVQQVRQLLIGLKVVNALAAQGDKGALSIMQELRANLQPRIVRI
jgi:hypothetical protein